MKKIITLMAFILLGVASFAAKFEKPILLTSVGQSADVQMVKILLKRAKIDSTFNKLITAEELTDSKTLILAIGGSSKGLGAAGIKVEDEIERSKKLIEAAKAKGMKVVGLHIGGEARRGNLSDKFVNVAAPECEELIVVDSGNKDGLFDTIAQENNIELILVPKITAAVEPLQEAFN
ncbi:DUF6305 family protein [Fusobacterium sp. MFO224]|uniref:DUF6305 family protein n=1 Tax=Fusobacterium sp. MFO224 TaxID=3378070 RepID=UPI0038541AE3